MRDVSGQIGPFLMDRFEHGKVEYVRHFHEGFDLSWQRTFQTSDADEVGKICGANDIHYDWIDGGRLLRTTQVCQGVARHPITGERMFFNQAHLFHATSLGQEALGAMRETFGADRLPRHSRYGDHSEIAAEDISVIHAAFRLNEVVFSWEKGDVLWVDNMQVAHGRRPFKGERRVLVALMDPSDAP
jgi:hypothetical protein